ncbi:hypothetical protein F5146DRAFT_1004099 [Armillaria mellea]|nr:hypothetical protein F5146DRAFT_1004099 [Armillaria mellea]
MDDDDDEEDFKEDEFGFDDNDFEPTSTISNEETEEHEGNSGRRVGCTDPMPLMWQVNINQNWGMYNLPAGSRYNNMVTMSTDGSGIRHAPLDPTDPAAWVIWDYMFLISVSSAGSLFDEAYDEPFKIYAAVNILMGIAHEINKSEKKPLTMGRGGRLSQVLSWLKARVGKHQYLTFWNWAQQMSQELSQLEMGGVNLDSEQSNMFHMLKVWQEVPARVAEPDAELHYLQRQLSLKKVEVYLKCQ